MGINCIFNFNGALRIYRSLYEKKPNDATLNYRMGQCHLSLKNVEDAIRMVEKARDLDENVNPYLYFTLGRAYHIHGDLDKAIETYNKFAQGNLSKVDKITVLEFLTICRTAKELMASPVPVKIENMGDKINSKYDDYHPSLTADQKIMIFTSRRPDTKGGERDQHDMDYHEDVYITYWDEGAKTWSEVVPIEGAVNTSGHDANLSITPSGDGIFIYKNKKGGDIYYSKIGKSNRWGAPRSMEKPVNSSYFESYACLSADGEKLFFTSEKKGMGKNKSQGSGDIYMSSKISQEEWSKPVNLGPVVNTFEDEINPFLHPDGRTLFFSSKGQNTMGGYDVFKTVLQDNGNWSKPVNLGYPINTLKDDVHFVLSTDGKTGYYASVKENGQGKFDIYSVDMTKYPVLQAMEEETDIYAGLSILSGQINDSFDGRTVEGKVLIKDETGENIINTIHTDSEGNYFVALPGDKVYQIEVAIKDYKPYKLKVELQLGEDEVFKVYKQIILDRVVEKK